MPGCAMLSTMNTGIAANACLTAHFSNNAISLIQPFCPNEKFPFRIRAACMIDLCQNFRRRNSE